MVVITDILIDARKGAGSAPEILFGTVTWKPTLAHARGTSIVLPAPTTFDLVDGKATATNVQPTPEPVEGKIQWGYEVTFKDRHSKTYSFLVGVPDSVTTVNFASLPRYFETEPPLFGQGPQGEPGEAATIAIGAVTSGEEPEVNNSGTNTDAVLNFVLPKGDKGDTGEGVPEGGEALQYIRKNASNSTTEWVSAQDALATDTLAGFMSSNDKSLLVEATPNSVAGTLVRRDSTGRVLYPDPTEGKNPVTRDWYEQALSEEVAERVLDSESELRDALNSLYLTKNSVYADPMDFGAAGDGESDDTFAFQAAVDWLMDNVPYGSRVLKPSSREYYLHSLVDLKEGGMDILGYGVTLKKARTGGTAATGVCFASYSYKGTGYGSGACDVRFLGLTLRGSFDPSNRRLLCLIAAHHVDRMVARDCTFIECSGRAHRFDLQGCRYVTIENCYFYGFDTAGGSTDNRDEDIQLDYSSVGGASATEKYPLSYDGLPTRDIKVINNFWLPLTIGSTTYPSGTPLGSHASLQDRYHTGIVFEGNTVVDTVGQPANYAAGLLHFVCPGELYIRNNLFLDTLGVTGGRVLAIFGSPGGKALADVGIPDAPSITYPVPQTSEHIEITGNTFIGYSGMGGLIYHSGYATNPTDKFIIRGNKFYGQNSDEGETNSGALNWVSYIDRLEVTHNNYYSCRRVIETNVSKNTLVADNYGYNMSQNAILVRGSETLTIRDNTLVGENVGPYSIYVVTGAGSVKILDNYVLATNNGSNQATILVAADSKRVVVRGNSVGYAEGGRGIEVRSSALLQYATVADNEVFGEVGALTPSTTTGLITVSGNHIGLSL